MSTHTRIQPRLRARLRSASEDLLLAAGLVSELVWLRASSVVRSAAGPMVHSLHRTSSRFSIRSLLVSTTAIGFGVVVAVTGAGGTFAFLNAAGQTGSASLSAGSAVLTVAYNGGTASAAATIPDSVWGTMLPGDTISQEVTVANPGAAKYAVSSRLEATGYYEVRTGLGTCATATIPAAALGTTATALTTLTAGGSTVVCVQVKLPTSAPSALQPGSASPIAATAFKLIFDGSQVQ